MRLSVEFEASWICDTPGIDRAGGYTETPDETKNSELRI
jgi:hypothetical protein